MASFPVPDEYKIVRHVQSVRTYVTKFDQSNTPIVRRSGTDRYPDPSEALLLSGNVTGSEPASCICILAAECRSDCVRGVGLDPYACSC